MLTSKLTNTSRTSAGSALTEVVIATALALGLIVPCGAFLKQTWTDLRCRYRLFEATHAQLHGEADALLAEVTFHEEVAGTHANTLEGRLECGNHIHRLRLEKIRAP